MPKEIVTATNVNIAPLVEELTAYVKTKQVGDLNLEEIFSKLPKTNSPDNSNVKSNPSNKNSQSKNDSYSIDKPKKQISNKIDSDKKKTTSNQNTQKQASPQQKEITKSEDDSEKKIRMQQYKSWRGREQQRATPEILKKLVKNPGVELDGGK